MSHINETPHGLLIFSIGPVQDFIATARRTQDLWMGSYILAYLSYVAMESIQKKANFDNKTGTLDEDPILFPVLKDHPFTEGKVVSGNRKGLRKLTLASLPNKFTVRLDSVEQGREFVKAAEKDVKEAWLEVAAAVRAKIPGTLGVDLQWDTTWLMQIDPDKWLEIYWVIYPNPDQKIPFARLNELAERALQARKGVRNFAQTTEEGERDTLSGSRTALGSKPHQPRKELRKQWKALGEALYREGVKKGGAYSGLSAALSTEGHEYLSAIDMTKRFAQRFHFDPHWNLKGKFPSTSSIASAVFRAHLLANPALAPARKRFIEKLQKTEGNDKNVLPETLTDDGLPALYDYRNDPLLEYDGELFYPDTYTARRLKDDFNVPFAETAVADLKQNVLNLRKAAADEKVAMPPTYYALLLMDGDKMGDHLAKIDNVAGQRKVSRQLMIFALQEVQKIVEDKYLGRVVYAGGDDLMAFLPLENVLSAAHDLNKKYRETMGSGYTASAGIAIAHHMAPLDLVLQAARAAEKKAKGQYGRNSIVFSLLKRSGEQVIVGGHWGVPKDAPTVELLPTIQQVLNHFQDEKVALSAKFAFDAEAEAPALTNLPAEANRKRLALLLKRHMQSKALTEDEYTTLAANLAALGVGLHEQLNRNGRPDDDDSSANRSGTVELAQWLLLARFFVAAMGGEE
ncbi:MAG: type III-B CRISPR-associated protein Cas10/Cmr2 [Anaerolineales bacterium]|nr:type III-B CRISPR-associated protein Cas10/Cmr2 [Anaerolineales bacterium]